MDDEEVARLERRVKELEALNPMCKRKGCGLRFTQHRFVDPAWCPMGDAAGDRLAFADEEDDE